MLLKIEHIDNGDYIIQNLELEDMYQQAYIRAKCFKGLFTHDISNLFHVISNSIELCQSLLKNGINTEEILDYFKLIEEQVNRGKRLVRNIKNLSELEESKMPLEPLDLFENLISAVHFVKKCYPKREIDIEIKSESERIYVIANDLLLDVFENILINSIDYNRNSIIEIEVSISEIRERSKNIIKLEFRDNGIGIDDKRKIEILQEGHKKSKNSKGMGLGLSLAATLINLYEGNMWIEDRVMGDSSKGSNFVILIPKATQKELYFQINKKKLQKNKANKKGVF
ncbi:MAG: sensor histidine kinase [Candidatus Hermodarchaeota archaeon]